jgi:DNA-binding MarR family transcriptional regulator
MTDIVDAAPMLAECHCFALRQAARQATNLYDEILAPSGLRISQLGMLALVAQRGAPTINDIAHALGIDRTTIGKNLRPLERDGLVVLSRSTTDGRSRIATLTSSGGERLKQGSALWRAAQRRYEDANGGDAVRTVEDALRSMEGRQNRADGAS